jgi:hypothetical protein
MKESKAFSNNLIQDCIKSFKEENGVDISAETAIEYLNSFARLYLTFARIESAAPVCEAPGGASPDLISPHSCK